MPLWQIYHPKGTFENEADRLALSKDITAIYTQAGLPPFYTVVHFVEQPVEKSYVGGEPQIDRGRPFIRIVITQIAIRLPDHDYWYRYVCDKIDTALKPHTADKGYNWEYHVHESDRRLWKVDGLVAPPWQSEEEKVWFRENKPVNYDGAYPELGTPPEVPSKL